MMSCAVLIILGVSLFLSEAGVAQENRASAKFKDTCLMRRVRRLRLRQIMEKLLEWKAMPDHFRGKPYSISKDTSFAESRCGSPAPVDGWASTEKGSRAIYFTDGPDFRFHTVGTYGPACAWHREIRGFDGPWYDDLLSRGFAPLER